jgi:hypothetical protein
MSTKDSGMLTRIGKNRTVSLGATMHTRLSELFRSLKISSQINVQAVKSARATAGEFVRGLLGDNSIFKELGRFT